MAIYTTVIDFDSNSSSFMYELFSFITGLKSEQYHCSCYIKYPARKELYDNLWADIIEYYNYETLELVGQYLDRTEKYCHSIAIKTNKRPTEDMIVDLMDKVSMFFSDDIDLKDFVGTRFGKYIHDFNYITFCGVRIFRGVKMNIIADYHVINLNAN